MSSIVSSSYRMIARQPYSQCLSGASLCDPHHVPATQGHREALRLDRCWLLEVLLHQNIHHILCQRRREAINSETSGLLLWFLSLILSIRKTIPTNISQNSFSCKHTTGPGKTHYTNTGTFRPVVLFCLN